MVTPWGRTENHEVVWLCLIGVARDLTMPAACGRQALATSKSLLPVVAAVRGRLAAHARGGDTGDDIYDNCMCVFEWLLI